MSTPDEPSPLENAIQAAPPSPQPPAPPTLAPADRPITAEQLTRASGQIDYVLALLLVVLAFALASFPINNSDFWMHLATGRALVDGTYNVFAGNDPFAFTTEGVRWTNPSWLFDWAIYGLYQLLGGPGLVVLRGLIAAVLAIVLLQMRRPEQSLWAPAFCVALALLTLSPKLLFQPYLISLLFVGITLSVLLHAGAGRSVRVLWLLPPLFVLWANLDEWFVLGPAMILLFLIGDVLQQFLLGSSPSGTPSRKTLGLVLIVGVLACLVNPSGPSVFALPPTLGYLVVQITGPSDTGFLAGGTTLQRLSATDPQVLSPFQRAFWSQQSVGLNVAGIAYFVLLFLGLISFLLAGLRGSSGASGLCHRLALWVFFALLSILGIRFVPFFAVLAGPITGLNLQDYACTRFGNTVRLEGRWRLWSLGGRLATAAAFLGLLFLAWPGWLNASPDDPGASHRVGWRLYVDPSLRRAAERIAELQQTGKLQHGFTYQPEVADYLSWFGGGAKGFIDHRLALFSGCASDYVRVRQGLRTWGEYLRRLRSERETPPPPSRDWEEVFRSRKINYLILPHLNRERLMAELALNYWLSSGWWVPLYADGRTIVLGWVEAGPPNAFAGLEWDLNRLAFGPVPENRRAPLEPPAPPLQPPGFWTRYWYGAPPEPLALSGAQQYFELYQLAAQHWLKGFMGGWYVATVQESLATSAAVPGSTTGAAGVVAFASAQKVLFAQSPRFAGRTFLRPESGGPPGALVLSVRNARRAVAASPADAGSHLMLGDAVQALWKRQEQFWVPYEPLGGPAAFAQITGDLLDRQTLRVVQLVAALQQYLNLQGDRPDLALANVHFLLFQIYERLHYVDVAVEHLGRTCDLLRQIDLGPEASPAQLKARETDLEGLQRRYQAAKEEVKKRQDYYDLHKAGEFRERFELALLRPYAESKTTTPDRRGLGLVRQAVDVLQQTNVAKLTDQEKSYFVHVELPLLLTLGRVREVRDVLLPNLRPLLGFDYEQLEVVLGAAGGEYRRADQALAALEKLMEKLQKDQDLERQTFEKLAIATLAFDPPMQWAPVPRAGVFGLQQWILRQPPIMTAVGHRVRLRELRGLFALEQGDTATALIHFQDALRRAGPFFFADRPIVEHYLLLLNPPQQAARR